MKSCLLRKECEKKALNFDVLNVAHDLTGQMRTKFKMIEEESLTEEELHLKGNNLDKFYPENLNNKEFAEEIWNITLIRRNIPSMCPGAYTNLDAKEMLATVSDGLFFCISLPFDLKLN